VKIPRWAFEKFPGSDPRLGIQMKSVGETMAIGRTFKEALQKGLRSLEIDRHGLGADGKDLDVSGPGFADFLRLNLPVPTPERIFQIKAALEFGFTVEEITALTGIDPWFLNNIKDIVDFSGELRTYAL
jgi:carbamoyl-phosphate synthase large subunit